VISFNEFFGHSSLQSPVPSPNNQTLTKLSPSSSPYNPNTLGHNYDFLPSAQDKSALKSKANKAKAFSSNSSVTSNGSSSSSKTNRGSRHNSQSSFSSGPGSNSNSSGNRRLSQLIFHEYRGPNLKSSKSSISLRTNISLKKNTNNLVNAYNFQKSNLVVSKSSDNNTNSTNTNEIFFDDSNDSTNNLNSAIMNIDSVSEALNPHKIRIKQQKIFLKYNSSKSRDSSNNGDAVVDHMNVAENKTCTVQHLTAEPLVNKANTMEIQMSNQNIP
jgi:hypothetical protein